MTGLPLPMLLGRAAARRASTLSRRERRRRVAVRMVGGATAGLILGAVAWLPPAWAAAAYIVGFGSLVVWLAWPR